MPDQVSVHDLTAAIACRHHTDLLFEGEDGGCVHYAVSARAGDRHAHSAQLGALDSVVSRWIRHDLSSSYPGGRAMTRAARVNSSHPQASSAFASPELRGRDPVAVGTYCFGENAPSRASAARPPREWRADR